MAEHFIAYYPTVKAELTTQLTEHLGGRLACADKEILDSLRL